MSEEEISGGVPVCKANFMAVDKPYYDRLRETVRFFASVIKSGESWSGECQEAYDSCHLHDSVVVPAKPD